MKYRERRTWSKSRPLSLVICTSAAPRVGGGSASTPPRLQLYRTVCTVTLPLARDCGSSDSIETTVLLLCTFFSYTFDMVTFKILSVKYVLEYQASANYTHYEAV
jgi:hypothetical protein